MVSEIAAVLSPLRIPMQALVVALAGAGTAWLFLNDHWLTALAAVAAVILVGVLCEAIGRAVVKTKPLLAVYLFEAWLLIPLAIAVLASAGIIVLAVKATLPEKDSAGNPTSTETEKLVGAVSAGITTFLTAAFVTWAGDSKDSKLSDHIMERFQDSFTSADTPEEGKKVLPNDSPGIQWVFAGEYEGIEGWGHKARIARAKGVAAAL